ncbi:MAG: hypothetical protein WC475_01975 [Candidatus Paceibacterota bacterium]
MKYIKKGVVVGLILLIVGLLVFGLGTVLSKLWTPVLSAIPKLGNPFLDFLVQCLVVVLLTALLCYLLGRLFATKIRKSIPFLEGTGDLNNHPWVLVEVFPKCPMLGIVTGKQEMIINDRIEFRPRVYVFHAPNPTNGFLIFPEKGQIHSIHNTKNNKSASVLQMIVSMGISGPKTIYLKDNGEELNSFFQP